MGTQPRTPLLACVRRGGCAALLAAAESAHAADVPRLVPWILPPALEEPGPAPAPLTLVWFDVQDQLPQGIETMASEVGAIFQQAGVEVAWRHAQPGDTFGEAAQREIAVIGLAEDPSPPRRRRAIMGLVVRDGSEPNRALWVFIGSVRRALGLHPTTRSPADSALVARALGRVIVHEVVHALAPGHPHDGAGLMRNTFDRGLLLGPRRPLGSQCARSVRAALAPAAARGPEPGAAIDSRAAIP